MYRMHRVFCATAWELEGERRAFQDVIGEVNETEAMPRGLLFVPVSLVNVRDKRPYQYAVDENIRACHYYMLAVSDGWGPPERCFERDYRLALACRQDPALPMRETAFLWQRIGPESVVPGGLPAPTREFTTTDDFKIHTRALLVEWLQSASA
jgi:hypothetical protein